jgi:hypothetical protein
MEAMDNSWEAEGSLRSVSYCTENKEPEDLLLRVLPTTRCFWFILSQAGF